MNLNVADWKDFSLSSICDIINGKGVTEEEIEIFPGDVYAVQGGASNNGCLGKISEEYCAKQKYKIITEPCLTVARVGSAGVVNFQGFPCVIGDKAKALILKTHKSVAVYLFIATLLNQNVYKYSYGRGLVTETYMAETLKLPICKDSNGNPVIDNDCVYSAQGYTPDFEWMEAYIKSLNHQSITTKNTGGGNHPLQLDVNSWQEFSLDRLFTLIGGFYNKKPEHSTDGTIPFLASTENNNGVTEYYSLEDIKSWDKVGDTDNSLDKKLYTGNCIAVTVNGSVCNAFYQARNFTCSHDITALYLNKHELTPSLALFLCTMIMKDKYRWSYGRKPHDVQKFGKSIIKLPVQRDDAGVPIIDPTYTYSDEGHVPDWEFMESYIKALPYGDRVSQSLRRAV